MDLHMHFMKREIMNQGEMALFAWDQVRAAIVTKFDPLNGVRVWAGLQAFATCQGIISNVLFTDSRGREIRERLVNLDLRPLESRAMRDNFTHFEERLRDFLSLRDRSGAIQDRAFSPTIGMEPPPTQLRRFNPETNTVFILRRGGRVTDEYEIQPMVDCIRQLVQQVMTLDFRLIEQKG